MIHDMNEHKNHVGCLSKSIKEVDQDLKNIRFHSLGKLKHSQHWQGYQRQSTPANSYSDNSDLRLIRTCLRPPFREDQGNIIPSFRYYSRPEILDLIPFRSHSFEKGSLIRLRREMRSKMH